MNKLVALGLAVVLVVPIFAGLPAGPAGAQVSVPTLPDPGALPDSPLYFLKSWRENIGLFFVFDAEKKAERYLHLAEVRLAEHERLIANGKEQIAQKTLEKYERQLERAFAKAEELKGKGEARADKLKSKVEEGTAKHLEVLERDLTMVSGSAREGIERALEASRKHLEKLDEIFDGEFNTLLDDDIKIPGEANDRAREAVKDIDSINALSDDKGLESELDKLLEGLGEEGKPSALPELTKEKVLELLRGIALDTTCSTSRVPGSYGSCAVAIERVGGEWKITVTYDGLYDDSIKAKRFAGVAYYQDGAWRVRDVVRLQQCWSERGHQDFSTAVCF